MQNSRRVAAMAGMSVLTATIHAFAGDNVAIVYDSQFLEQDSVILGINSQSDAVGYLEDSFFDYQKTPVFFGGGNTTELEAPGFFAVPSAINASQVIVGWDTDAVKPERAIRWLSPDATPEFLPGLGMKSRATGINDAGIIVGWSEDEQGIRQAFRWENGSVQFLGALGGEDSEANAINSAGQITGWAETANDAVHAFLWEAGVMTDLGDLLGSGGAGISINDSGVVVGSAFLPDGSARPFRWENGGVLDLGILGNYDRGEATAVNPAGDIIVGHVWHSSNPPATETAFIHQDGQMTPLKGKILADGAMVDTNLRIVRASQFNESGAIAGVAVYGGPRHGAVLQPVEVGYEYEIAFISLPTPPPSGLMLAHGMNEAGKSWGIVS